MNKNILKKLRFAFLVVGGILLAFLIHKIGVGTIVANIRTIGWWFVPIVCMGSAWYFLYTVAWRQFLGRLEGSISLWELFRIKITGEAVNTLTPASFLGGDPMRVYLLKKNFPATEGAASVVVDRTLHSIAILTVVLTGIIAAFLTFDKLPPNIQYGVPIVMLVAIAFMAFILIHQHKGFFSLLMTICRRLHIKRSFTERTIERFEKLDAQIIEFYEISHKGFWLALICHIAGRFLGVIEIYAIGRVVSDDFTLFAALILTALSPIVNAVFVFVPGALGVMEGAYGGVLYLLGIDPSIGITIQIAKRLRAAIWILIGLIFLGHGQRQKAFHTELVEEEI
jgi:uncharacterized protein (TIRG00374 family)